MSQMSQNNDEAKVLSEVSTSSSSQKDTEILFQEIPKFQRAMYDAFANLARNQLKISKQIIALSQAVESATGELCFHAVRMEQAFFREEGETPGNKRKK